MNTSTTQPCAANLFRPLAFSFCATLLTLLLVAVSTNTLRAQTTLGPGDLAFTMMNMEGFHGPVQHGIVDGRDGGYGILYH